LLLGLASGYLAYAERPLPQHELKAYALHEDPNSADISPDDSLVVTELSRREPTNDPSTTRVSDVVQLWNFRDDKLVAENVLRVKVREKREPLTYSRSEYVRYSTDGKMIIAYLDRFLHVLRADDLRDKGDLITRTTCRSSDLQGQARSSTQLLHRFGGDKSGVLANSTRGCRGLGKGIQ